MSRWIYEILEQHILWILSVIAISCILFIIVFKYYRRLTRQISCNQDFKRKYIGQKFKGIAVSVYDGDGFRFVHTPLCFKFQRYKRGDKSLSIRLAGIDAPEMRSYNKPAQKFSKEAADFLKGLILNKKVVIEVLLIDIYNRLVCMAYVRDKKGQKINVSLEMVKNGWACVYYGNNAVYGGIKENLDKLEFQARRDCLGMWADPETITPMEFKKLHRNALSSKTQIKTTS